MLFMRGGFLLRRGLGGDAATAAVETHPHIGLIHNDGLFVDVGNVHATEIIDGAIVGKHAVIPMAAFVSGAAVAEAVIDAAIEADMLPPITGAPDIDAVAPAPIAGRPQQPDFRRLDPGSGNPKVAARTAGPVAWCPDVTGRRYRRLVVNRQLRRRNIITDANHLRMRTERERQQSKRKNRYRTKSPHITASFQKFVRRRMSDARR